MAVICTYSSAFGLLMSEGKTCHLLLPSAVQNIIAIGNNQAVMQNYNQAQFTALTELVTELVKEVQAVKDAVNALDEKVKQLTYKVVMCLTSDAADSTCF